MVKRVKIHSDELNADSEVLLESLPVWKKKGWSVVGEEPIVAPTAPDEPEFVLEPPAPPAEPEGGLADQ